MLEYFGVITGLLYMVLEIRQHRAMWIVGFITSLVYVFVFFSAKVYADMGLQIYYVLISIYGFWLWTTSPPAPLHKRGEEEKVESKESPLSCGEGVGGEVKIQYRYAGWLLLTGIVVAIATLWFLVYYFLSNYTDSPIPVGDALTTAIGIVATWMLAKRFIEHWYFWILANAVSIYIYYLRELYPTMFLYLCYTIISIVGLYTWLKKGSPQPPKGGGATKKAPPLGGWGVIVANGTFPTAPLPLEMLKKASVIIACDGAVEELHNRGFTPDAIIGDLDSIPEAMQQHYADRIHIDKDQETNDLTKAVQFAHRSGIKEALIIGATGLREDHTLGNISLLSDYGKIFDKVEILTDYGWFTPFYETTTFESHPGQQISIFSLSQEVKITTENLRWPLHESPLTAWWQGTLNEALGETFTLRLSSEGRFILYRLYPYRMT